MDESSPALWAVEKSGGKWQMARHLAVIDRALVRAAYEPDQRIIVQMPPRHGKSTLISQYFPAWYRRRFPTRNLMMWSATASLAQRFSTYVRDLCGFPLDETTHSWQHWKLLGTGPSEGEFHAAGIGGGSTMGAGCHCFQAGTMVYTEVGPVDIAALHRLQMVPRVLSFNFESGRTEWRHVIATSKRKAERLATVTTCGGRRIESTPDHRFYVKGEWVEARRLRPGDPLTAMSPAKCESDPDVQLVRQESDLVPDAVQEGAEARVQRRILLPCVFREASSYEEQQEMSDVREYGSEREEVLQPSVHPTSKDAGEDLHPVPAEIPTQTIEADVLLERLPKFSPFIPDDRETQFQLSRPRMQVSVAEGSEAIHSGEGQWPMRRVLFGRIGQQTATGDSPHRQRSNEQHSDESCDALCDVPCDTSFLHGDAVSSVTVYSDQEVDVYDLEVEGCHCFFADEILVHNCGIIDDYHRNVEDALSETIRAKQQQWFLTSCLTRLEPGASFVMLATRWHVDDLIGFALRNAEETGQDWEVIKMKAIGDDGAALWPERWPLKRLLAKKAEFHKSGYPWMWDALYQQEPPAVIDSEWDPAYFHRGIMFDQWPENISFKVVVLDPSVGHNEKTDPSAIVVAGVDGLGHVWVDADIRRRDAQVQVNDVMWWFCHERAAALGIEINGFQGVLRGMFERKCQELCFYPLIHGISSHIEKRMKIRANVTPLLSRGMLHFKKGSPGVSLLLEQLRGFPSHKHDDGPDALAMAIGLIHDVSRSGIPSDALDVQYEIASA